MLEKLIPGRYINIQIPMNPASIGSNLPHGFALYPNQYLHIRQSGEATVRNQPKRISTISVQRHPSPFRQHRTFRWLPWVPGVVTCVPLAGPDILTGPMTGCWLAIFSHQDVRYVAHIGTDGNANTENTIDAKTAWNTAINATTVRPLAAFDPLEEVEDEAGAADRFGPYNAVKVFGHITAAMQRACVVIAQDGGNAASHAILHTQEVTSRSAAPQFQP